MASSTQPAPPSPITRAGGPLSGAIRRPDLECHGVGFDAQKAGAPGRNPSRLTTQSGSRALSPIGKSPRDFAEGDRIQFTATNRDLGVSNRDLGAIERIDGSQIAVRMDGEKQRTVTFDASQMRHFDHGYAVTSHSSQGLTSERVLDQHGHDCSPRAHQYPLRLRLSLAGLHLTRTFTRMTPLASANA